MKYEKIPTTEEKQIELEINDVGNIVSTTTTTTIINNGELDDDPNLIKIKVKNAEDPIIYIKLKPTDKVQLFKSTILKIKDKPSFYNCRIIFNGKMLKDDQTISESKLNNDSVVICSITEPINLQPTIAVIPPSDTLPQRHLPTTATTNIHQDFILDMERTRMLLNANGTVGGGINNNEEFDERQIANLPIHNSSLMPQHTVTRESLELFFGLSFGFFFGVLSLFWVGRMSSRTARLGIIIGVIFSVSLSLVKLSTSQVNP